MRVRAGAPGGVVELVEEVARRATSSPSRLVLVRFLAVGMAKPLLTATDGT
jgi:hypothetical protein